VTEVQYRKANVDGFNIFCREAGEEDAPVLAAASGISIRKVWRAATRALGSLPLSAPDLRGFG
jgi:hypothetical protein